MTNPTNPPAADTVPLLSAEDDFCPDCFRNKAHSVQEVMWGYCEKWWAIRDPEARVMCARIANRIASKKAIASGEAVVIPAITRESLREALGGHSSYNNSWTIEKIIAALKRLGIEVQP